MRILEHFDVTFTGPLTKSFKQIFTLQDDAGKIFDVKIPGEPKLVEAFRWMGENDCLRHLRELAPEYRDNTKEIEDAKTYNDRLQEHFHLMGGKQPLYPHSNSYYPVTSSSTGSALQLQPIPSPVYSCTWTFYSREHAVMFKLACG